MSICATDHSISLCEAFDTLQRQRVLAETLERSSLVESSSVVLSIVKVVIVFVVVVGVLFFVDVRG